MSRYMDSCAFDDEPCAICKRDPYDCLCPECPQCGGPMSKAFAAPTFHFKGSGWAKKDRKSVSGPVKTSAASEGGAAEPSTTSTASSGGSDTSATASGGTAPDAPKEG